MRRKCFHINDELTEKLEYFIYDYSGLEYHNLEILVNDLTGNKADKSRLETRDAVYRLRKILAYNCPECVPEEDGLAQAVDLFLLFLRTSDVEASLSLEPLLDTVWKTGGPGREWNCVRRLTGVLASVYLLYFLSKSRIFAREQAEEDMSTVFRQNIPFYTEEDRRFLTRIFMVEKRFDCLLDFLRSDLKPSWDKEGYTAVSEDIMAREFFRILHKIKVSGSNQDAMTFYEKSEPLFRNLSQEEIKKYWEKGKAGILFDLGKYEEAKDIQDKYIDKFGESKNVSDLYNGAIYYAWAADYKEKEDPDWEIYIEKAYGYIQQAEQFILGSNLSGKPEYQEFLYHIILEKAFLLSEKNEYEKAYECFEQAFSRADQETRKNSNFSTHMWILMKYMCSHPDKTEVVTDWIERLYQDYPYQIREYKMILDFVHSSQYLRVNEKIYQKIYESLILLLFHALEIRHETKVRDISRYDILYYTKIEHLRLLLEDEEEKCNYRLPMFHVYHMNDPQEGKILRGLLDKEKFVVSGNGETEEIRSRFEENYVFLKSFFCYHKGNRKNGVKEFLPMWVQYGDDARGCCVILDNKSFENSNLRRIVYLTDNGECDARDRKIQMFLDQFRTVYQDLVRFCTREIRPDSDAGVECVHEIENLTKYIVSQISYLFKNESYKHENEVRLIINRTSSELDDVKVIPGKIPKVYIYNDKQTYIREVILGSKIDNPEDYVSFIYKQGSKMWKGDKKTEIKVTQSAIQYR